jgi:hypothetical protein
MQLFVSDSYISAHQAIAQLHTANTTLKTLNMIEQLKALNNHGSATTKLYCTV